MSDQNNAVTLKEWANIAIAKHSSKIFKYETEVIKDKDPEDLHQMRVGMRRLRSAITGFAIALDLPVKVHEKNVGKIGRYLGKLRDLDVLLANLSNYYYPLLPAPEQKKLEPVIKSLNKDRKKEVKKVRQTLNSKLYLDFQQGLQNWLEQPLYQNIGDYCIYLVLPDLLLPQISKFLLHPGWLVGVKLEAGKIQFSEVLNEESVEQLLEKEEPMLHDLRKEAKRTRYNLELFSQFYNEDYINYVQQIEQIQEVLGQIQDCYVLKEVLEAVLKSDKSGTPSVNKQMPELAKILTQTRYQKWQEWFILQKQFLNEQTRNQLRNVIQQPIVSE